MAKGDLSYAQLEGLWIRADGPKALAPLAAAIAEAESHGDPGALNPDDNGGTQSSFGLWQISNGTHTPPSPNWSDPIVNARLAVAKYHAAGDTFEPWGTYTSGAYKAFISGKTTPDYSAAAAAGTTQGTEGDLSATCAWGINMNGVKVIGLSIGPDWQFCLLQKSQARAVFGMAALVAGVIVLAAGVFVAEPGWRAKAAQFAVVVPGGAEAEGAAAVTAAAASRNPRTSFPPAVPPVPNTTALPPRRAVRRQSGQRQVPARYTRRRAVAASPQTG